MSAIYDLFETPSPNKQEKQPLHARIVSKGTISKDEFLDRVHKFTGISRSLLTGAMESFSNEARDLLAEGWNIEIGNFGFLSTSLECPPVKDKKEIRSTSIKMKNIHLRASRSFKKEVSDKMRLQRGESPIRPKRNSISRETCLARLNKYLENHLFISRTDYSLLTGRNKKIAIQELNSFISDGVIRKEGVGKLSVYTSLNQSAFIEHH